jgi:hypothetical protein
MRVRVASVVLAAALAVAGCASRRQGPCEPLCITECRPAPTCCEVWIPERCDRRLAYRAVAPDCRTREMPEYGLCQRTTYEDRVTPVTSSMELPETCSMLVPTYEKVCVPCVGYRPVQDYEDRLEPVCCPRYTPVWENVRVPVEGCVCDPCGNASYGTIGCRCEKRHAGYTCRMVKQGERLVQVNVGEHLEPYRTGSYERVCVPTGSRTAEVVVGMRYGTYVVGERHDRVVADRRVEAVQTGVRREEIVERPCHLQAYEEQVRVPGYRARVCENPRHRHDGVVLTREEYQALTGRSAP